MFGKNRNRSYSNGEITILWQGDKCTHSTLCYSRLRSVFDPIRRPWVNPMGAPTADILAIIEDCPSEALTFRWNDESRNATETSKKLFSGDTEATFTLNKSSDTTQSSTPQPSTQNTPSTDSQTDRSTDRSTDSQTDSQTDTTTTSAPAPTKVDLRSNGPIVISGNFEVIGANGVKFNKMQMISICRCGASGNQPYCDGTHFKIGFRA